MQRSTSGGLLALLLAVAACGFAAIALAAPPQQLCSGGPIRVTEVFLRRGLAVPSFAITDSGDVNWGVLNGMTFGYVDPIYFGNQSNVFNSSELAGMAFSQCFQYNVTANSADSYCTTTLDFDPHGSITFMGPFPDHANSTFSNAVVGGTGIFKGASGTTNVTVVVQGNTWQYDVQLIDQPSC